MLQATVHPHFVQKEFTYNVVKRHMTTVMILFSATAVIDYCFFYRDRPHLTEGVAHSRLVSLFHFPWFVSFSCGSNNFIYFIRMVCDLEVLPRSALQRNAVKPRLELGQQVPLLKLQHRLKDDTRSTPRPP